MPAAAGGEPAPSLIGVVGPGFTISLKNPDGTKVSHLEVGMYVMSVDDQSIEHNFHLSGPGVEQATEVELTGMTTWNIQVVDGTYRFGATRTRRR